LRNVATKLKRSQRQCLQEAKLIYQASTRREAIGRFRAWSTRWREQAERAGRCLEADLEELLAFYDSPQAHWKRPRTTNVIERLFVEVRRRIRAMCAFTTRASCECILFSVFCPNEQALEKTPSKNFYTKQLTLPCIGKTEKLVDYSFARCLNLWSSHI
jgi:transposase-like protein